MDIGMYTKDKANKKYGKDRCPSHVSFYSGKRSGSSISVKNFIRTVAIDNVDVDHICIGIVNSYTDNDSIPVITETY